MEREWLKTAFSFEKGKHIKASVVNKSIKAILDAPKVKKKKRQSHKREDGPVVYPANAFDSRLRGD